MYCKYCGQLIDDDFSYCKHCGKMISEKSSIFTKSNRMLKRFTSLTMRKQLIIILCSLVYFVWICIIIENADNHDDYYRNYVAPFFVYGLFFPYLAICLWYIYRKHKFLKKKRHITSVKGNERQATRQHNATSSIAVRSLVNSEILLEFAKRHGKMQVVSKASKDTRSQEHYCLFTSSDGQTIEVGFSKQIATFEAKDISENKHVLCVNYYNDNTFELDYISDKQINDSLPI